MGAEAEVMQGRCSLTHSLTMAGSACFLIPSRTTCPGTAFPRQSLVKKMTYRLAYRPV